MLYKKPLLKTAIATLLLTFISNSSFAHTEYGSILESEDEHEGYSYYYDADADSEEEKPGNFYMSFNYGKMMPNASSFNVMGNNTQKLKSSKNLDYKNDFAGNAAIGYRIGNIRVELEGHASSATTHIQLENSRGSIIKSYVNNLDRSQFVNISTNDGKTIFFGNNDKNDGFNFDGFLVKQKELLSENLKITNEGLQNKAAMINAYYDINNSTSFTPYFGVGGGLTNVKFFGVSKITPAMQGKLGLHYNISDKIQLSGGYRYFTSLGNSSFDGVKLDKEIPGLRIEIQKAADNKVIDTIDLPGATTAAVESKFANHALEVGLIFNF